MSSNLASCFPDTDDLQLSGEQLLPDIEAGGLDNGDRKSVEDLCPGNIGE